MWSQSLKSRCGQTLGGGSTLPCPAPGAPGSLASWLSPASASVFRWPVLRLCHCSRALVSLPWPHLYLAASAKACSTSKADSQVPGPDTDPCLELAVPLTAQPFCPRQRDGPPRAAASSPAAPGGLGASPLCLSPPLQKICHRELAVARGPRAEPPVPFNYYLYTEVRSFRNQPLKQDAGPRLPGGGNSRHGGQRPSQRVRLWANKHRCSGVAGSLFPSFGPKCRVLLKTECDPRRVHSGCSVPGETASTWEPACGDVREDSVLVAK